MSLLRGATLLALSWAAEATSEGGNCSATCVDLAAVPDFATCTDACVGDESWVRNIPAVLFAVVLVLFSGMFSGLTLGLLSLSIEGLEIVINGGSADEAKWAETILPLRRRGNLLLCTLLLGNTLVNAVIAILLADLTSGLAGGLLSTAVIVIFGEILPQAVCSRYGLRIGAAATCIVKLLMYLFSPVTMPIAFVLDLLLGREMSRSFNRLQLDKLLEMHLTDQAITTDDQMLLSSALHFSSKVVEEIMTPLKDVFAISVTDNLDFDDLKAIYVSGYTRIPVYHNRRDTIVGIVYTKDLILVDPNDEIPVASVIPFCSRAINAAPKGTTLEKLLADMQASRSHLYFVTDTVGVCRKKLPRVEHVIGIVTMEDLIEELISIEIIDESDTVTDNISKKRVNTRGLGQRRIEFFEMLQKRELLLTERILSDNSRIGGERPTADEVRAITSYLSNNVANFRPPHMSLPLLRRLLLRCSITSVSPEQVATGRYVYVRGVPASFCCLVLHGRLQIRAGNEGFTTEIGAWTTLATQALTDVEYTPDFTARVEVAARILIISRAEVHAVLGITGSPAPYSRPLQVDATHPGGAAVESMYGLRVDVSPTMQPAAVPQSIASAPLTAAPRRNSNATQGETIYGRSTAAIAAAFPQATTQPQPAEQQQAPTPMDEPSVPPPLPRPARRAPPPQPLDGSVVMAAAEERFDEFELSPRNGNPHLRHESDPATWPPPPPAEALLSPAAAEGLHSPGSSAASEPRSEAALLATKMPELPKSPERLQRTSSSGGSGMLRRSASDTALAEMANAAGGGQKSPGSRTSGQLSHEQGRRDKRERGSHE